MEKLDIEKISDDPNNVMTTGKDDYTHTVFIEIATARFCGPCHGWNTNIYNTYQSGNYDFEYVEMVVFGSSWSDIVNMDAYNWANSYGITGYPTSIMDGNYRKIEGNLISQLPGKLDICGNRAVKDIVADLIIEWIEDVTFYINISILNNEASQYNGHIHVPITELSSRYTTSGGNPYHFVI